MVVIRRLFQCLLVVGLLVFPSEGRAQNAFAGIYTGNFSSSDDSGQFAVLVRTNGAAIFMAFDNFDETGFVNQSVTVAANGTFSKVNIDGEGANITGQFTASGVSGTYTTPFASNGTFSGTQQSNSGSLRPFGGFYSGPLSGNVFQSGIQIGTFSGTLYMILAANGVSFSFFEGSATASGITEIVEVGLLQSGATASNICQSVALGGVVFTCNFNSASFTFAGTFSITDGILSASGNWSLTRRVPLPNSAPVAVADGYTTKGNRSLVVAAAGVLGNDSDPDGDPLTANLVSGPTNGSLSLQSNGGFTYTPTGGFSGVDSFSYRANDGLVAGNTASVTITVEAVVALPWLPLLLD